MSFRLTETKSSSQDMSSFDRFKIMSHLTQIHTIVLLQSFNLTKTEGILWKQSIQNDRLQIEFYETSKNRRYIGLKMINRQKYIFFY